MEAKVRITRDKGGGSENGVPNNPTERVYVTGPLFTPNRRAAIEGRTRGIYSTGDRDDIEGQFTHEEAAILIARRMWRDLRPEIEEA